MKKNDSYINKIYSIEESIDYSVYDKIWDLSNFEFNYEYVSQPWIEESKIELFCKALNVIAENIVPRIKVASGEIEWAKGFIGERKLKKKIILIGVKSTSESRDWPLEKWKFLIDKLKNLNDNIIIVDKEYRWDDEELIFFNNHSLRELFSLVAISDLVLCNDSGLLHIAGSLDKRVLAIFGPTDPKVRCIYQSSYEIHNDIGILPPWYDRKKYIDYFESIAVEDVERKVIEILENGI